MALLCDGGDDDGCVNVTYKKFLSDLMFDMLLQYQGMYVKTDYNTKYSSKVGGSN